MKKIPLSRGEFALVDDLDFKHVNQFRWCIAVSNNGKTKHVFRWVRIRGKKKRVWMHHFVTGLKRHQVDHKDGNGLNNQRSNLRKSNFRNNLKNRGKHSHNTSGFKGVCVHKQTGKWCAAISIRGKPKYLGLFKDPKLAAARYDSAAIANYGEFARTNKMMGLI